MSKIVGPVAPAVEFRTVKTAPMRTALMAIAYTAPPIAIESRVRLLNSFVPPVSAAKVRVAFPASAIVTVLVPATQDDEVEAFVQVPFTVHVDPPRLTIVPAETMPTLPLTDTAEFSARNVPWTRKLPFTVSAQLFAAVVSSVPVNPVMSMPPIVVAAASVTVPVGFALKTATSVAAGVQLHGAPPEEFDQLEALFQAPPFPIR